MYKSNLNVGHHFICFNRHYCLMQPSKQNSAASAFTGGADKLFGKQKRAVLKLLCNAQQQFLAQFG